MGGRVVSLFFRPPPPGRHSLRQCASSRRRRGRPVPSAPAPAGPTGSPWSEPHPPAGRRPLARGRLVRRHIPGVRLLRADRATASPTTCRRSSTPRDQRLPAGRGRRPGGCARRGGDAGGAPVAAAAAVAEHFLVCSGLPTASCTLSGLPPSMVRCWRWRAASARPWWPLVQAPRRRLADVRFYAATLVLAGLRLTPSSRWAWITTPTPRCAAPPPLRSRAIRPRPRWVGCSISARRLGSVDTDRQRAAACRRRLRDISGVPKPDRPAHPPRHGRSSTARRFR